MWETIVAGLMITLGVGIGTLYISKKLEVFQENLMENAKNSIETWLNSEQGQKALFSIGALIGNGAKSGFGITARGGKFKLTDVIGQGIAQYFMQKLPIAQEGATSSSDKSLNI